MVWIFLFFFGEGFTSSSARNFNRPRSCGITNFGARILWIIGHKLPFSWQRILVLTWDARKWGQEVLVEEERWILAILKQLLPRIRGVHFEAQTTWSSSRKRWRINLGFESRIWGGLNFRKQMGRESHIEIDGVVDSPTDSVSRNTSRYAPHSETNGKWCSQPSATKFGHK